MANKTAQTYLKQVRHFLICDRTDRKRLFERCKELVASYQLENAETGYTGIVSAFGEPEACAKELLSSLGESRVESACKRRKLLHHFAVAVVCVALITSVITASYWYLRYCKQCEFDDEFILVIGPATEITEEEFIEAKMRELQSNGGGA